MTNLILPRFTVFGLRVRAHSKDCAGNFREDRKHRLIYPSFHQENDSPIPWEGASVRYNFCVYCGPRTYRRDLTDYSRPAQKE